MKKALLVGINRYPDPRNELKGCVNDVRQVAGMLKERYGFPGDADMRLLTDARATTKAILDGLAWLTAGASPGDSLVFHYSGHGSQVPDMSGDETTDRLAEILFPYAPARKRPPPHADPPPGTLAPRAADPPPAPHRPPVRRRRDPHQRCPHRRLQGRPDFRRRMDRRRLPRGPHVPPLQQPRERGPRPHLPQHP